MFVFFYHIPVCGVVCVVFGGVSGCGGSCDGGGKDSFVKGAMSDCCGVLARKASIFIFAFVYCIHIWDIIVGDDCCWWC